MENFIRRENLTIFRRRLAETNDDTQRQILLKLLAEEEARGDPLTPDTAAGQLGPIGGEGLRVA